MAAATLSLAAVCAECCQPLWRRAPQLDWVSNDTTDKPEKTLMIQSIIATITTKDGMAADFQAAALQLVAAVRANEPGCLLYTLSKGEATNQFVFMERYQDEEALKAHGATEHFKTLGRAMGPFMDGRPAVQRMVEVG
jgi:quinol monooxygenase YgiN